MTGKAKPNRTRADVGREPVFKHDMRTSPTPPRDPDTDESLEQEHIRKRSGVSPNLHKPTPQRTLVKEPSFVKVATGILVFYRDGDRLLPEHEGLETVPAVLLDGAYQPG